MIRASRYMYYKMYWIWIIYTNPNEYSLDRGLGLVAKDTDCRPYSIQSGTVFIIAHTPSNQELYL